MSGGVIIKIYDTFLQVCVVAVCVEAGSCYCLPLLPEPTPLIVHTHHHIYTLPTTRSHISRPQGHLKKFNESVQEMSTKILQAALALHDKVSSTFRKTAINFHYEFTVCTQAPSYILSAASASCPLA